MRSSIIAICSALLVLVSLIGLFVQGCAGGIQTGTIEVKATLCGEGWEGEVSYTLALAEGAAPVYGTRVPYSYRGEAGDWTCAYAAGGPAGAYLVSITPAATQELRAGGKIAFALNFELEQDAAIKWLRWTVDGEPIEEEVGKPLEHKGEPCQIVGARFGQRADGCPEYRVTVNETSRLMITQVEGTAGVKICVINESCAVTKTPPPQGLPPSKKSQVPSVNSEVVQTGRWIELPAPQLPVTTVLDVETTWELENCLNYTKSVNWLGISRFPFEPPAHECVLFELILPGPGLYKFILIASGEVGLMGKDDVNSGNNHVESPPLTLIIDVPF